MKYEIRRSLPPLPERIAALPVAENGYPTPFFVKSFNGVPDFRVVDEAKIMPCLTQKLCWICGQGMTSHKCFSGGPLSAFNRAGAEPPSHRDCAIFASQSCPHFVHSKAKYRTANMPANTTVREEMPEYNPGVNMVYVTKSFKPTTEHGNLVYMLGEPEQIIWFHEGQPATREQVLDALGRGVVEMKRIFADYIARNGDGIITERMTRLERYLP